MVGDVFVFLDFYIECVEGIIIIYINYMVLRVILLEYLFGGVRKVLVCYVV